MLRGVMLAVGLLATLACASAGAQGPWTQVEALTALSRTNFEAIRVENSRRDSEGNWTWDVHGFEACGPGAASAVWWWRALHRQWEYVCEAPAGDPEAARARFGEWSERLRTIDGFAWREIGTDELIGTREDPPIRLRVVLREGEASPGVAFWFQAPGRSEAGEGTVRKTEAGELGRRLVSARLEKKIKRLVAHSKKDFAPIRKDAAKRVEKGDWSYPARGFNACGPLSTYSRVWWWRSVRGNWEYVCHVDLPGRDSATAYFSEAARRLEAMEGWTWTEVATTESRTVRRLRGLRAKPKLQLLLDLDRPKGGGYQVELWLRQRKNTGPVLDEGADASGLPADFEAQLRRLIVGADTNFESVRVEGSRIEREGDEHYVARGITACGPASRFSRVWHWRGVTEHWEYVCVAPFDTRRAAGKLWKGMRERLVAMSDVEWRVARRTEAPTVERLIGRVKGKRIQIRLDRDEAENQTSRVELSVEQLPR